MVVAAVEPGPVSGLVAAKFGVALMAESRQTIRLSANLVGGLAGISNSSVDRSSGQIQSTALKTGKLRQARCSVTKRGIGVSG